MLGRAPDRRGLRAPLLQLRVLFEQLGETVDGIQRRAQFVAKPRHVTGFGKVRGLGFFFGILQREVGAFVGTDFLEQKICLPLGLGCGVFPAFAG